MLSLSDILKLSSLGSSKLFNLLKRNNLKLSKKVLNYSIKQVVITHIITSEDCIELRSDIEKLKCFSLSQIVDYLKVNYVQVRIEDILNNLWTVISKNLDRLNILQTDFEVLLNSDDFCFETVESLVKNSKEVFVDANNEVDGLDFLEAKKSYKLYANIGFLRNELERLKVKVPARISKVDYMNRVLYALGSEASSYEERIAKMSFDELDDFVKHEGIEVDGYLGQDDLIKLLVNYYASHNEVVTKVEYESIIKLDFNNVNTDSFKVMERETDANLMNSINDVLNFGNDETSAKDDELDDILDELDNEVLEEVKEETVIKPNYPDSFLNSTIKADGSLEEKASDEEENYNLNGLFDDDLINSVLNDDVSEEVEIKPHFDDDFLNSTINADGTLSPKAEVKEQTNFIDKDLVNKVIEEETRFEPKKPVLEPSNIISNQIREQIGGVKAKELDVRLTNLQSDFKVETNSKTTEDKLKEAVAEEKEEISTKLKGKKAKKAKKVKKEKKQKKTKIKSQGSRKKNNLLLILVMIWFIIMIMILLIRFM